MDPMSAITILGFLLAIFFGWEKFVGFGKRLSKPAKLDGKWMSFHLNKNEAGQNFLKKGKWKFHRTIFNMTKVEVTFKEISSEVYTGNVIYFPPVNIFSESFKEFASIRLYPQELFSIMLFGIFKETIHGIWFGPENNHFLTADYFILTSASLGEREAEEKIIEGRKRCLAGNFVTN